VSDFDLAAIWRGALGVLMFFAPAYVLAKILAAGSDDSLAWMLLVVALIFGTTFGGYVGARERPRAPLTHGALSAAAGLGAVLVVALFLQAFAGNLSLGATITALVIWQLGTALGSLGALLAVKGMRPQ
jgi:hypothetical protein